MLSNALALNSMLRPRYPIVGVVERSNAVSVVLIMLLELSLSRAQPSLCLPNFLHLNRAESTVRQLDAP